MRLGSLLVVSIIVGGNIMTACTEQEVRITACAGVHWICIGG